MKILILGGGQDGIILSFILSEVYKIRPYIALRRIYNDVFNKYSIPYEVGSFIDNEKKIIDLINHLKPTYIINTVALSSTSECKDKPEIAHQINTLFPIRIANIIYQTNIKLVHLGSLLENESRDECVYTKSKKLASVILNKEKYKNTIINIQLPNHESPLRDERFFVRELITKIMHNDSKLLRVQKSIQLTNGTVERYWSWAPNIMNKLIEMILDDKSKINLGNYVCKLSLIKFSKIAADQLGMKDLIIECGKTGIHYQKDIKTQHIEENIKTWIKLLFSIKFEERFNLEKWCKVIL